MISTKELQRLYDSIYNKGPAKTTLDIYRYANIHKNLVLKKWNIYIKSFEDCFDALSNTINELNYVEKNSWPPNKGIQYMLYPETLKTLHCSFEVMCNGYYEEALILQRSVYETYLAMLFTAYYPSDCESVLYTVKGKRVFNVSNFLADNLKVDWGFIYRVCSYSAHRKKHTHSERLIQISKGMFKKAHTLTFEYDEEAITRPLNMLFFLQYVLTHFLIIVFENDISKRLQPKIVLRLKNMDRFLRAIMEGTPNKYAKIPADVDKIDSLITLAMKC